MVEYELLFGEDLRSYLTVLREEIKNLKLSNLIKMAINLETYIIYNENFLNTRNNPDYLVVKEDIVNTLGIIYEEIDKRDISKLSG